MRRNRKESQIKQDLTEEEFKQVFGELVKKKRLLQGFGAGCIVLAFLSFFLVLQIEVLFVLIPIFLIIGIVLLGQSKSIGKQIKEYMSRYLVNGVLRERFSVSSYQPMSRMADSVVRGAGLIDDWDRADGSDYVEGRYEDMEFCLSDLHLERKETHVDSKGRTTTTYVTVFQGLWLTCRLARQIQTMVRVLENRKGLFGGYAKSHSDVETESATFNEKFQILTDDPHTAFYVLTPHFMEYMLNADALAQGRIYFCFKESVVHIAIHTGKDLFELKSGENLSDLEGMRNRLRGEVRYITDILDELRKNEYLFSEE